MAREEVALDWAGLVVLPLAAGGGAAADMVVVCRSNHQMLPRSLAPE